MTRVVRGIIVALLALAIIANGVLAAAIVVTREPQPRPLTPERVGNASKPAIVFIQANYTITSSLPQYTVTDATWQSIYETTLRSELYAGASVAQLEHDAEQLIMNNPDAYLSTGITVADTWDQWATGSGFFVTEDGYLVTAAHVVTASKAEVRDEIVTYTKDKAFIADARNVIRKSWADFSPTDEQVDKLVDFDARWVQRYVSIDKIDSKYYLASGASVQAGDSMKSSGVRASVVSIDPTSGGHDIAIMKADITGVPALTLAGQDPQLGDSTYAIGYPRTAYLQESVPTNQSVPIAVTTGKVQGMHALSSSAGSWSVFGTDAQFTHGDSGGPVVDARGNVIGVISFIIPSASGNQLPGQGYFVPSSYISQDLAKAGVTITPDTKKQNLTNTYYRALAQGDIKRYKPELNLLLSIESRSPWNAYVKDEVSRAQSQVLAGNDKTPPDLTVYVLPAAASSAGIILLSLIVFLVVGIVAHRRPRPAIVEASPALTPVAVTDGALPETQAVASPQEELRESEPIASGPPPATATD